MDKLKLIEAIVEKLESELAFTQQAVDSALEGATHEDARAENQYDTRGVEASYLAGAQAERAAEIETAIVRYQSLTLKLFDESTPIGLTALIGLDDGEGQEWYFLGPEAGGLRVSTSGVDVRIVTAKAPLGRALVGQSLGDITEIKIGGRIREYEIVSLE